MRLTQRQQTIAVIATLSPRARIEQLQQALREKSLETWRKRSKTDLFPSDQVHDRQFIWYVRPDLQANLILT
jgi:hypothetical protein